MGIILSGDDCVAQGNRVTGFRSDTSTLGTGISVTGPRCSVLGGTIDASRTGVALAAAGCKAIGITNLTANTGITLSGADCFVEGCFVEVDATIGLMGINISGANANITGCTLLNTRAVWAGETPIGIRINATGVKIDNSRIDGWRNATDSFGYGIQVVGGSGRFNISDCSISTCWNGVEVTVTGLADWSIIGTRFRTLDRLGIAATGCSNIVISGCNLEQPGDLYGIFLGIGTLDSVVTGNYINGNTGATNVGIELDGTDTGPTRTSRFTVTGNTIEQVSSAGILLSGYVQNGSISGNQVDGFLSSAPLDPTATGIRLVTGGAGTLIKSVGISGNTVQRCTKGITLEGTITVPIDDVTIDGNTIHHCGLAQAAVTITNYASFGSFGIGAEQVRRLTVSNNTIYKIGRQINASDVEGFPTSGGTKVVAQGVTLNNCRGATVVGNTISDIMSTGSAPSGFGTGIYLHQGSAGQGAGVTFSNRGVVVSDNNIFWNTGLAGNAEGTHGILVQVEKGTDPATAMHLMAEVAVGNNTVQNVQTALIAVSVGEECSFRTASVVGNSGATSDADGILLSISADGSMHSVAVRSNTLEGLGTRGVVLDAGTDASVMFVQLDDNVVRDSADSGIVAVCGSAATMSDVSLSGNAVSSAGAHGVSLTANTTPGATEFTRFNVSRNTVTDPTDDGIHIQVFNLDLEDLVVDGNTVGGDTGPTGYGIYVETDGAVNTTRVDMARVTISNNRVLVTGVPALALEAQGTYTDLVVANNQLKGSNNVGQVLVILTNGAVVAADEYHDRISITGNVVSHGIGSSLYFDGDFKVRDLLIAGNQFIEADAATGVCLAITLLGSNNGGQPSINNWSIIDNMFRSSQNEGLNLNFDSTTAGAELKNIKVSNNNFQRCAYTGLGNTALRVTSRSPIINLDVSGNLFENCGAVDDELLGNVHLALGSDTATANPVVVNLQAVHNQFRDCLGTAIHLLENPAGPVIELDTRNVNISGNMAVDQRNNIVRVTLTAAATVRDLSVCENSLSIVDTTNEGVDAGISVSLGTGISNNIRVNNNTIDSVDLDGIDVILTTTTNGLQVNGNVINGVGAHAISVVLDSGNLESASVSNNTIKSPAFMGVRITDGVGAGFVYGLSVQGNTVSGSGQDGIRLFFVDTTTFGAVSVNDNIVRDWGTGIVPVDNGIRVKCGDATSVSISNNDLATTMDNVTGFAVDVVGVVRSFTITDNALRLTGATTISMLWASGAGADQFGVVVTGNTFSGAVTGVNASGSFSPERSVVSNNCERTSGGAGTWATFVGYFTFSVVATNQD